MSEKNAKNSTARSLTTTLTIGFAFLCVTALLISGCLETYILFQTQQEALSDRQQRIARQAAGEVAGFIQEKLSVMETAVRLAQTDDQKKEALPALIGLQPAFRQVIVFNTEFAEQFRATRMSEAESIRLADRIGKDLFSSVKNGKHYIGAVYVDPVTSEPLVTMAVPMRTLLGDVSGALVAEVNLKFMWDLVDRLKIGESGHAYVVDREGRLIAFGDTGRVLQGKTLAHLEDVSEFMRRPISDGGAARVDIATGINGDTVVGTYVALGTPDWAVMTELPVTEAYRHVIRSTLVSLGMLMAMAALAALAGVLVSRHLTVRILDLTETATRIAGGEMDLKAQPEGPAEVIRLADAFNHMTRQLRSMLDAEAERTRRLTEEVKQRKKAEHAFIESDSVLRATLESTRDGVLVVNQKGKISHYNKRFNEIWSIPKDLLSKGDDNLLLDYVLPQLVDPERFSSLVKGLYQSSATSEDLLTFKDGRILERFSCPLIQDGRQEGRVWFFRDITERKKAEEELRQLRNYLANIINSMPSVLVGVNTEGRVTQWNKQAETATGLSFERARAQPLVDVFPRLTDHMDHIREAIADRKVIFDAKTPHQEKAEARFEDVTIFPLVANGVEGAVIRVDDVTDRVRLEEMMIQSEKMLSIGGLAAGMAHEINNPLAGILQNTSVMGNRLLGDLPANRQAAEAAGISMEALRRYLELRKLPDMLDNIRISGNRAATIVKNMLGFARKSDRIVSSCALAPLLDQTVELAQTDYDMKKRYDFKKILIVREYDDTVPPVPCEASKIQQVFLNILKNGAEAMAEMGNHQRQPTFWLRLQHDDTRVCVEIEDNGPGMDEKTRRSIFEPFFTTKPVGKGTGLGLSVSYFIITEDHGGEMRVHAAEGVGTRFVIRLPKAGKHG